MNKYTIKKHINYLLKDFLGEFNFLTNKIYNNLYSIIFSHIGRWKLKVNNVKYGKNLKIRGRIFIARHQLSDITIGNNVRFNSSSRFNYRGLNHRCIIQTGKEYARIYIGNDCGFSGVSIVSYKEVYIGNHVSVGANSIIGDRDDHSEIYASNDLPIKINDNVWIGMNVTILKGVTIGRNSIIGAGSIVTSDIPENVIAAGIPCKVIRKLK